MILEKKITEKVIWTSAIIVDLPFGPFEKEDQTESLIIEYIANRMLQVARNDKRYDLLRGSWQNEKDKNFKDSTHVVAIDVASIRQEESSYLNHIFKVIRVHPCLLVNCEISHSHLLSLALHNMLKSYSYILPVLRRIPPTDFIFARKRYGDKLFDLIAGNLASIDLNQIEGLDDLYSLDDLLKRFPGLRMESNKLYHELDVVWLGVDNSKFAAGLTKLFNKNIASYKLSDFCCEFGLTIEEIEPYLHCSMLFAAGNSDTEFAFRLLKKNILPKIMHSMMHQFENRLIEEFGIDTTYGGYPGFSGENLIEYHSIGKIFDPKDTFACKLICYVRQCFKGLDFDTLVLLDNGKEKGLYDLIPNILYVKKVVRIINYFGDAIFYPFEQLEGNEKVVVLADVAHSGKLLNKACKLITVRGSSIIAIFSFLIDSKTSRNQIFSEIENNNGIVLNYYFEKDLDDISKARTPEHENRFMFARKAFSHSEKLVLNENKNRAPYSGEAFLMFWEMVNRFCNVNTLFTSTNTTCTDNDNIAKTILLNHSHQINFKKFDDVEVDTNHYLYLFFKWVVENNSFSAILIIENQSLDFFENIVKKINPNIPIYHINSHDIEYFNFGSCNNILIINISLNVGLKLWQTVKKIKRSIKSSLQITYLTIFVRKNRVLETQNFTLQNFASLSSEGVTIHSLYSSGLPFYIFDYREGNHRYLHSLLQNNTHEA